MVIFITILGLILLVAVLFSSAIDDRFDLPLKS